LRLRPSDLDELEGALHMQNLKQRRRANKTKLVYVSAEPIGDLRRYARDARIRQTGYLFGAQHRRPRLEAICRPSDQPVRGGRGGPAAAARWHARPGHGEGLPPWRRGQPGTSRSATQRSGAALGHARLDTAIYARLANAERRAMADRVAW
jgi:hypothetical protein